MKTYNFEPMNTAVHSETFSIAVNLDLDNVTATDGIIKAGTILGLASGKVTDSPLELLVDADGTTVEGSAILISDFDKNEVDSMVNTSVGVLINGVVYTDVIADVNTQAKLDANKTALQGIGITFYNVKTLK